MDFGGYLEAIRRESEALAAAARLGLEPAVPSCPGWTVGDVVGHTGRVHRHKEKIVRERWQDEPDSDPPPESGLVEWFEEGAARLLETLAGADPAFSVYTWHPPDRTVGFWYRRMAHETAVHRVDAQLGHGASTPVEPDLAADGVDEIIRVMMIGAPDWAEAVTTDRTVRLSCTDRPGSWTLRFGFWTGRSPTSGRTYVNEPGLDLAVTDRPGTGIRATANDLLLFLWGRGTAGRLEVAGDPRAVEDLRSIAAAATG